MRNFLLFLMVLSLALPVFGQQTGDMNRDYTINGNGAGGTSPVVTSVSIATDLNQLYTTLDPGAPVFLANAFCVVPGALVVSPSNSVDLQLATAQVAVSGLGGSLLSSLFWTDGAGTFNLVTSISPNLGGLNGAVQMAHLAASSPDGFWVSQAHDVTFTAPFACAFPGGVNIGAGDDTATNEALGFSYSFYGTAYTDLFIGSNGFITFGAGDTGFIESTGAFLSGPPRIGMWWDDLSPNNAGSVNFFTDNAGIAEVCFLGVPEFSTTGANSFNAVLDNTAGTITQSYDTAMTSMDGLVGMSPGGGIDPFGLPLVLSAGPNTIPAGMAAFELFDLAANPNNLQGSTLVWTLDATGNPISQN